MNAERILASSFLAEHRNGLADDELTTAIDEVVEAVLRIRKPGTITLTLKVACVGDMVEITDETKAKPPIEADPRLYWRDLSGNLTRNNPMQPAIPGADPYAAPQVDPDTGEIIR